MDILTPDFTAALAIHQDLAAFCQTNPGKLTFPRTTAPLPHRVSWRVSECNGGCMLTHPTPSGTSWLPLNLTAIASQGSS